MAVQSAALAFCPAALLIKSFEYGVNTQGRFRSGVKRVPGSSSFILWGFTLMLVICCHRQIFRIFNKMSVSDRMTFGMSCHIVTLPLKLSPIASGCVITSVHTHQKSCSQSWEHIMFLVISTGYITSYHLKGNLFVPTAPSSDSSNAQTP